MVSMYVEYVYKLESICRRVGIGKEEKKKCTSATIEFNKAGIGGDREEIVKEYMYRKRSECI